MKKVKNQIIKAHYETDPDDSFQTRWFVYIMNLKNLNYIKLGDLLHLSKQTICNYMTDKIKVPFNVIAAICYVLNLPDDANEVYENIMKEA